MRMSAIRKRMDFLPEWESTDQEASAVGVTRSTNAILDTATYRWCLATRKPLAIWHTPPFQACVRDLHSCPSIFPVRDPPQRTSCDRFTVCLDPVIPSNGIGWIVGWKLAKDRELNISFLRIFWITIIVVAPPSIFRILIYEGTNSKIRSIVELYYEFN